MKTVKIIGCALIVGIFASAVSAEMFRNDEHRARVGEGEYQRIRAESSMERLNAYLGVLLEVAQKQRTLNAKLAKERARTG